MFGRKKKQTVERLSARTVPRNEPQSPLRFLKYEAQTAAERELYRSLRESVPIIDAAISKIVRLMGGFRAVVDSDEAQREADRFVREVRVGGAQTGLHSFACSFLDSLLTYGEAVGEMIPRHDRRGIAALYQASLDDVEIVADGSPLNLIVRPRGVNAGEVKYPALVFPSLLNQREGTARGTSLLGGLPFVSGILLRILRSVKNNWERAGDVRYAVTYTPDDGTGFSEENAGIIAEEWKKAMRGDAVCDFVSVGNVSVKVIGAESEMPDCEIPVKVLLEQIVSKLGIPPFLLGLSWSSTERMSEQQADILTSELEYYRSVLEPVLVRCVRAHLRLAGFGDEVRIEWDDINLQDALALSQARLNNAQASRLELENEREEEFGSGAS